jgi:hypothetical protein
MDPILSTVQQNLDSALSVPFVSSSVVLGLAFYGYKAGPELPSFVEELFENLFFKIFVGFLVLYMSTGNFMLSLVVSGVFVYGLDMLKENFFNVLGADYVSGDPNINQNGGGKGEIKIKVPTEEQLAFYLQKGKDNNHTADTIFETIRIALAKSPYNLPDALFFLTKEQFNIFNENLKNALINVYGSVDSGVGFEIYNKFQPPASDSY